MQMGSALFLLVLVSIDGHPASPSGKAKQNLTQLKPAPLSEAVEIAHCLKTADLDWLADSVVLETAKRVQIGLRHDRRTYPGQDVIIVVVFEGRSKGHVFEVIREDQEENRAYRIENNGSFRLGNYRMEWRGEILGGIWTHEYMEKNIRRIMRGPKVWVDVKTAEKPMPEVACTWYGSN